MAKVAEPEDTNVVDLMAALRASLGGKGDAPAKVKSTAKPAAKSKTATKPASRTAAKAPAKTAHKKAS